MIFKNTTALDRDRLFGMFVQAVKPFPIDQLEVRIRYSRSSDFSGTCHYHTSRLYVNLGRHLTYPYLMDTYIARAVTSPTAWWKPLYSIELADGYQVVLFVLLHEYCHWLIKRAGRNTRQKESMCDRFAARILADRYGATIRDPKGRRVPRDLWDIQDVAGFVASALIPKRARPSTAARVARTSITAQPGAQLLLFNP
ncbi:MAG: hypothetical protein V3W34_19620 [Phycisphaerae bacterium]